MAVDPQPPASVARISPQDEAALVARAVAGDRAAGGPPPATAAERRELSEQVRRALAELPERRRIAVVLFDVEGYAHAEIAHILGIPEGTVRSEVFHARRRLRVLLGDWKEQ